MFGSNKKRQHCAVAAVLVKGSKIELILQIRGTHDAHLAMKDMKSQILEEYPGYVIKMCGSTRVPYGDAITETNLSEDRDG